MSLDRFSFEKDFLLHNTDYSIASLQYCFQTNTYTDPYINSAYESFNLPQTDVIDPNLFYYVCVNKKTVSLMDDVEHDIDLFIENMEILCKQYDADGFFKHNSVYSGFGLESFFFKSGQPPSKKYSWVQTGSGWFFSSKLRIDKVKREVRRKCGSPSYNNVIGSLDLPGFDEDKISYLQLKQDILLIGCKEPLDTFGVCIPTTQTYIQYLLNNEF